MSAIATFHLMPMAAIDGLRAAAQLQNGRGLKGPVDEFFDFLKRNSREVAGYNASGWVLSTLIEFLNEKRSIDLTKSSFDELSKFISKARGSAYFVLTDQHRRDYLNKLDVAAFNERELRDYYNEFTETDERDIGRPMLEGVRALHQALSHLDEKSIILLEIG